MSNYREEVLTGKTWLRSNMVYLRNEYGSPPSMEFLEERITSNDDSSVIIKNNVGSLRSEYDPLAVIELLDPDTLLPTGQATTDGAILVALLSKYVALAKARDDITS